MTTFGAKSPTAEPISITWEGHEFLAKASFKFSGSRAVQTAVCSGFYNAGNGEQLEGSSVPRSEALQLLGPVQDQMQLRKGTFLNSSLDHDETLTIWRNVVASTGIRDSVWPLEQETRPTQSKAGRRVDINLHHLNHGIVSEPQVE